MTELQDHQKLCREFAALFSYPDASVRERAASCAAHLQQISAEATASLESFIRFLEANGSSGVEQAFTGTFDLQALCHPYVGYQLCGESQQRTMFLIKLRELYRQYNFTSEGELPDHLSEVLRFLGSIAEQACRQEIIEDGLLPALAKMTQGIEADQHPYVDLIRALQSFLSVTAATESELLVADQ